MLVAFSATDYLRHCAPPPCKLTELVKDGVDICHLLSSLETEGKGMEYITTIETIIMAESSKSNCQEDVLSKL